MATRKIRITGNLLRTDGNGLRTTIPLESGSKTYTELSSGEFGLADNTAVTIGIGQLLQGNYLYAHVTTGPVRISVKASTAAATCTTLLSNGFMVVSGTTFANFRARNVSGASTTIKYMIAGD